MVRFYVARIRAGRLLLADVPLRWRDSVREELESDGNM